MALIKLGGLAQDVRGSQNGLTFSRNTAGAYVRAKSSPVQPQTQRQLQQRAIFTQVSQAWGSLTGAQRTAWNAWALTHPVTNVFGDAITINGNSAFTQINANLLTSGEALQTSPPAAPSAPVATPLTLAADSSTQHIEVVFDMQEGANEIFQTWASSGRNPGSSPAKKDFRLCTLTQPGTTPFTIDVAINALNPLLTFAAGQEVSILVARISDEGVLMDVTKLSAVAT